MPKNFFTFGFADYISKKKSLKIMSRIWFKQKKNNRLRTICTEPTALV